MNMNIEDKKENFLLKVKQNPNKIYNIYFGLKAAPLTLAHEKIIEYVHDEFLSQYRNINLIIGVANSPWKCEMQLFDMVFAYSKTIPKNDRIIVFDQDCWTNLYDCLKSRFDPNNTLLIVGEDEWNHIETNDGVWKKVSELTSMFMIHCAKMRNDNISASKVRDIFYRDPDVDYFYVKDYISKWTYNWIKNHGTFWQLKPNYRAEENLFIEKYDPSKFNRPSVTVDNIVWRQNNSGDKEVLLIRRGGHPYKNFWALPGGFLEVKNDASLKAAAKRELAEETLIVVEDKDIHQFKAYGDIGTDPRTRIIDVVFATKISVFCTYRANDDAFEAEFFNIDNLPKLAFNHNQIITEFFKN